MLFYGACGWPVAEMTANADCHLNWGWGKATARPYRSDEIFWLSTMGYKKFLSGAA